MELIIRPQTAEEAFLYFKGRLAKRKFYQENGYSVDIPEHTAFIEAWNNPEELSEEKENELQKIFVSEIYPKLDFSDDLLRFEQTKPNQ